METNSDYAMMFLGIWLITYCVIYPGSVSYMRNFLYHEPDDITKAGLFGVCLSITGSLIIVSGGYIAQMNLQHVYNVYMSFLAFSIAVHIVGAMLLLVWWMAKLLLITWNRFAPDKRKRKA